MFIHRFAPFSDAPATADGHLSFPPHLTKAEILIIIDIQDIHAYTAQINERTAAMYRRKRAIPLGLRLAVLLLTVLLASCAAKQTLTVSSLDYDLPEKLKEGRLDTDYAEKMSSPSYAYSDRNIYISVKNDVLLLSASDPAGGASRSLAVAGGCLVGTDGGREGPVGCVVFRADDGTVTPVVNENCRAIFAADAQSCLLITCVYGDAQGKGAISKLYRLERADDGSYRRRSLVVSLDGVISAACLSSDGRSVAAALNGEAGALVKIAPDGRLTRICESELLQKPEITSVVELRGIFYCSSKLGILACDPSSETEHFFPIDWSKLEE